MAAEVTSASVIDRPWTANGMDEDLKAILEILALC